MNGCVLPFKSLEKRQRAQGVRKFRSCRRLNLRRLDTRRAKCRGRRYACSEARGRAHEQNTGFDRADIPIAMRQLGAEAERVSGRDLENRTVDGELDMTADDV